MGDVLQGRRQGLCQGRRDNHRTRSAVLQDIGDGFRREQRVDRHRHDAGPHRAPEGDGEVDRVLQQQHDTLLPPDAGGLKGTGEPLRGGFQRRVGQGSPGVLERRNEPRRPLWDVDQRTNRPRCDSPFASVAPWVPGAFVPLLCIILQVCPATGSTFLRPPGSPWKTRYFANHN